MQVDELDLIRAVKQDNSVSLSASSAVIIIIIIVKWFML